MGRERDAAEACGDARGTLDARSERLDELAILVQAGDRDAQQALTRELVPPLTRFLRTHLFAAGLGDEVEDLMQECLIAFQMSLASFRGDSSVLGFAFGIARKTARNRARGLRRNTARMDRLVALELPLVEASSFPEQSAVSRERAAAWLRLVQELPYAQATALRLRLLDYSFSEIAAETGVSINTVRKRLALARRRLIKCSRSDPAMRDVLSEFFESRSCPTFAHKS